MMTLEKNPDQLAISPIRTLPADAARQPGCSRSDMPMQGKLRGNDRRHVAVCPTDGPQAARADGTLGKSLRWLLAVILAGAIARPVGVSSALGDPSDASSSASQAGSAEIEEYDPWEPFNEAMFSFNRQFDRFVLKPLATVWDKIVPDPVQTSLKNALDNAAMPRRLVNNLLQRKVEGAGREAGRFLVNSTIGVAGFFDVAKSVGLEKSEADTGQTLGVYGSGPGPYLVLPFLPPLTVRDGIGAVADAALDPLWYVATAAAPLGMKGGKIVNDRSLNLEFYENVEESVVDLYSAVRNAYLQRRQQAIQQ
ncbi:MAG: VacJ family lipoprotein [candidate division NC10 bacterium]|nr:VacJ family lipoprotein [candidate division NC10 bacterium]